MSRWGITLVSLISFCATGLEAAQDVGAADDARPGRSGVVENPPASIPAENVEHDPRPYRGIVDRNVFNLKAPPRPEDNIPPPTPPPKVTLTGITTILGNKVALFRVAIPPRPPAQAKEESYMLAERQSKDDIEVLEIDEVGGRVKMNNKGTIQTVDFLNNGSKPQGPSAVAGILPPGTVINPQGGLPVPPAHLNQPANPAAPPPQLRTIPQRQLRMPVAPPQGQPNAAVVQPGTPNPQPPANLTPEAQVMSEIHEVLQQENPNYIPPPR